MGVPISWNPNYGKINKMQFTKRYIGRPWEGWKTCLIIQEMATCYVYVTNQVVSYPLLLDANGIPRIDICPNFNNFHSQILVIFRFHQILQIPVPLPHEVMGEI